MLGNGAPSNTDATPDTSCHSRRRVGFALPKPSVREPPHAPSSSLLAAEKRHAAHDHRSSDGPCFFASLPVSAPSRNHPKPKLCFCCCVAGGGWMAPAVPFAPLLSSPSRISFPGCFDHPAETDERRARCGRESKQLAGYAGLIGGERLSQSRLFWCVDIVEFW